MYNIIMGIGQLIDNVQPKHVYQSRPGVVGSVGDVIVKTRFRQSTPFMPWAYDPYWAGDRANGLGSNVQNGDTLGWSNSGGPARCFDSKWVGNRSFRHQYGWTYHDIKSLDKSTLPVLAWQGDTSWRRKLGRSAIAKRTGSLFSIKPMGFNPSGPLRGGNFPTSETAGGTEPAGTAVVDTEEHLENVNAGISKLGAQGELGPHDINQHIGNLRGRIRGLNIG